MKKIAVVFISVVLFADAVLAQGQNAARPVQSSWRKNTAIVLFSGIGGSLLGLSTLSFYGRPQEHTNNITLGALIGVIAGIGYVAYQNSPKKVPQKTYDYYSLFPTHEPVKPATVAQVPSMQVEFSF
jgi:hypothetical protein